MDEVKHAALQLALNTPNVDGAPAVIEAATLYVAFMMGASAPAGEAPAATTRKKKSPAQPATETTKTAVGAAEEDLFGSASGASPPKTDAPSKSAPATASPSKEEEDLFGEKTAPAADKPKATIEQLRKALTECQTKHGHKDHALGVLKKHTRDGNPTISTLDEAKYQDVIDACAKYVPAK